jgi:hypothetical protein
MAQDVLFINWLVMALSIYSDWAWYLYLIIPGYGVYNYGGMLKDWVFAKPPQEAPLTEAEQKRMAKKERQSNRIKYVNH